MQEDPVIPMGEPTVRLLVTVLTDNTWVEPDWVPPIFEYVYTPRELNRVINAYGNVVAEMLRRTGETRRFRIVVRGAFTDRMLAADQWVWDARAHAYFADGVPFVAWPPKDEIPDAVRIGAALYGGTPLGLAA